nr:hypothetical protein BaRGS_023862 [Batillaria attramentaria]
MAYVPRKSRTACEQQAVDIGFLLDSSISEGASNFQKQVDFVKALVSDLEISRTAAQVGLVTFSTDPHRIFFLNQYYDKNSVLSALGHVPYLSGATYTQRALVYMREHFFTASAGSRSGVPKVLILLTDGKSTSPTETAQQARLLKEQGIYVIAVGIGFSLNQNELHSIASDSNGVVSVSAFSDLLTHIENIEKLYCQHLGVVGPAPSPTTAQQTGECGDKPADIIFVLDSSASEGSSNLRKQVQFVGNITSKLTIGPNDVQVGLLTFATSVHNQFYLNAHSSQYSVLNAIQHVPYQSGATYTGKALRFVRLNSLSTIHGHRPGSQPIVIILTDGQSSDRSETVHEAQLLKGTGAVVIAVGIGSNTNDYELRQIATDTQHVFNVRSFDFLFAIQQQILTEACGGLHQVTVHPECGNKPADIVFLMDSSSSEDLSDFQKMKEFVSGFARQFQIGPSNVQVAAISFSSSAHVAFYLNTYHTQYSLLSGIANVHYYGGSTHTDLALSTARNTILTSYHGARSTASKAVILLTDGRSINTRATELQAQLLRQAGARIITIGVGSNVNHQELEAVASDVQHSFSVASFSALQSIKDELVATACESCSYDEEADILLVLDASTQQGQVNFIKEVSFATKLLNEFTVGPDNMQFSAMTYASLPNAEFWFNSYNTKREMVFALQTLTFTSGSSNLAGALKFAREYAYAPFHGARDNTYHYAIVMTDGVSDNVNETIAQAALLKQQGVVVMAVGIGDQVDQTELAAIASDPNDDVFMVSDYDALNDLHTKVKRRTCST